LKHNKNKFDRINISLDIIFTLSKVYASSVKLCI